MKSDLIRFPDSQKLAAAAAHDWIDRLARRDPARLFAVSLLGGRIARSFFEAAAREARAQSVNFTNVHFFWGDERCLPANNPDTNFHPARESFFDILGIPGRQIHRIRGELPPEEGAAAAAAELKSIIGPLGGDPILDLALLGMGEDGHTASLFPGTEKVPLTDEPLFRPIVASKPPPHRITMGYKLLARSREVWVLASGSGKEMALQQVLKGSLPLGRLIQLRSATKIYTDIH